MNADTNDDVPGFGLLFNVLTPADYGRNRKVHPYTREVSGMFLEPNDPHENSHGN